MKTAILWRKALVGGVLLGCVCNLMAQEPPSWKHTPKMSYIDNGVIRLGVDLNLGGAITYLSRCGTNKELNIINTWDWGRQVQLSYYSGPVPFQPNGVRMAKEWAGLGWNPIQTGDCYGFKSKVLETTNQGKSLYVKCIPMQWPLENTPGECECEVWLQLDGPVVKARCRLNNHRSDHTQYSGRGQELPAVYVNAPFYHLMTYKGDKPYTGDALSSIRKAPGVPDPWSHWIATENWAAEINDQGWGLGVWNPDAFEFSGDFAGTPGVGGPLDDPTGYISPTRTEILDHNIVYDYQYELIVGTVEEIRNHVYQLAQRPKSIGYRFDQNRQGFYYVDATDSGWPIKGELDVHPEGNDPQVISPVFFIRAEDASKLKIEAAFDTKSTVAQVFWRKLNGNFSADQIQNFAVKPDGEFHLYEIDLAGAKNYDGTIVQIRIDPVGTGYKGARFRLKSFAAGK